MILMTYREFELEEGRTLNQVLYDFQHEHLSLRIKLSRLTHADTEQFLTSFLHEDVDCEFLEHVYKETEGNPFFIEEVCKALIEAGDLYRQCGCWHWPVMAEIEIPQSIKVAIQARVGKLPSETQDVLRTASIFGREFDFTDLCEVSELSENQLLEALENAERAQLVSVLRRPGKGRSAVIAFNFSHALIASSLRESMSSLRRQRLHHKVGLALERLHSDRMEQLAPQLGRHFAEAGLPEKAVEYLLQAGDVARQVFAYPEAIEYYQNALLILKEQDDFGRASHTLIKLGLLYHSTLDFESSRKAYQEGFNLWRQASETQPTSLASDPLRIASYPPITFDPGLAYENNSVPYIDQLFVGLVSLTEDLDVVPELAESWEVLENGQKYIFHLRKDAYWSDGQPVTAGDIEFAWKRILTPETRSRNHVLFYDIRGARDYVEGRLTDSNEIGVRARDPYTLEVELEQPASYFLHLLTYAATFPVPPHAVKAFGSDWTQVENIVTNGPFILEYYHPNKEIGFTRNSQYSGKRSGNLERAEINISPDMADFSTRLADYEAGKLDAIGFGGLAMESDRARQKHAGEYVTIPVAMVSFLVFRLWQAPFDDVRIRRAFVQSIDREMLAEVCLHGYAAPALSGLVPPGLPGHLGEPGLPFNPNEARRLLADAGYPNGKGMPEIDVWLITPENSEMMEFIQENWLEHLGVASRWITMTAGEMYGRLQREDHPSVFFNGWLADYPDPDTFLRVAIAYQTSWHYPPYEELIEKARRSPNQAERMNLYHQAERILIQEAPVMPMFYGRSHIFIQPWVRRFPISPIQPLILKDVVLERRD
jgi:oligopeptide transport system substrate-binding protein